MYCNDNDYNFEDNLQNYLNGNYNNVLHNDIHGDYHKDNKYVIFIKYKQGFHHYKNLYNEQFP